MRDNARNGMKKKILALIVVALALLTFAFTSCTTEEVSDVSMFEAYDVTKDFVDKLKNVTKLMPHFHISMQSGCTKTLNEMRRKYHNLTWTKKWLRERI